ncbi:hypothetical protein MPNT_90080 [Candidatus Methylacidithermus pantelleriae]|uniref:Uncharacterized protein n=1 Tax=Candidatus Methylacidithermus pantelleriae TaxID=2744239 RepID=A0A8J2BLR2_9BACT|nr:hypothetical protein MPNT_90080 [Candidatus Methylacidithermus pantelleriae]
MGDQAAIDHYPWAQGCFGGSSGSAGGVAWAGRVEAKDSRAWDPMLVARHLWQELALEGFFFEEKKEDD